MGEKIRVVFVDKHGFEFKTGKGRRAREFIETYSGETYPLNGKPVLFNGKLTYFVDKERGVVLEPEIDENVMRLKTNPELLTTILEPEILHRGFKYRPTIKHVVASFIVGLVSGVIFFAPMF